MVVKNLNNTILKKQKRQKKSRKIFKKQNFSAKSRRGGNHDLRVVVSGDITPSSS